MTELIRFVHDAKVLARKRIFNLYLNNIVLLPIAGGITGSRWKSDAIESVKILCVQDTKEQ
jgi:hypothetical protein